MELVEVEKWEEGKRGVLGFEMRFLESYMYEGNGLNFESVFSEWGMFCN